MFVTVTIFIFGVINDYIIVIMFRSSQSGAEQLLLTVLVTLAHA